MSNSDSHKKQPFKKSINSYALLVQGFSEVEKTNPKSSNSTKKSRPPEEMNSKNDDHRKNPSKKHCSNNDVQGDTDPDIPDRSYGDYFCKLCDSHMNSDNMWEAHITGKRHMKNVKKGEQDSKYEDLPNEISSIKNEMKNVKDPVVGLSYIHEIRRKEDNVPPIYNCFLCHASIATVPLVTEHVLSMKHRLNYIKENNPEEYELIEATNLKKGHMEPLVIEAARDLEQRYGRGEVKVKKEKKKNPVVTYSAKRSFNVDNDDDDMDDDDRYRRSYKSSKGDSTSIWKSVDTEKHFGRHERSRSPRDFENTFRNLARSRSPRGFKDRQHSVYSDEEHSMDAYKRSSSKRERSPRHDDYEKHRSFSKSDKSPRQDDYHFRSTDDYSHSSRIEKNKQSYVSPRYDEPSTSRAYEEPSSSRRFEEPSSSKRFEEPSSSKRFEEPSSSRRFEDPSSSRRFEQPSTSQRSDLLDRLSYTAPRYDESTRSRELLKQAFKILDHQKSASFSPQENYLSVRQRPVESHNQLKTVEDVLKEILLFSSEDCYRLFYERMKLLPEITKISEMFLLVRLITEAQTKLKSKFSEQVVAALTAEKANATNIPGLGDVTPSPVSHNIRLDKSSNAVDAENFIKNILRSANAFPVSKPSNSQDTNSYKSPSIPLTLSSLTLPSINSQQAPPANSFQAPPANSFQSPPANSFQSPPANSFQSPPANSLQASPANSYQTPPTNSYQSLPLNSFQSMPFASGSTSNSVNTNMPSGLTQKPASESQIFNYSHYSSTSSVPKNYPHKY